MILSEERGGESASILDENALKGSWPLWDIHGSIYRNRFAAGHVPWGAWFENTLAHVAWTAYGSLTVDELVSKVFFPNTTTLVYDVFTRKEYRGHGLFSQTLSKIARTHFEKGGEEVIIYADRRNAPSRASIRNAGGIEYASSVCLRLAKVRLMLKSPQTIFQHVEAL